MGGIDPGRNKSRKQIFERKSGDIDEKAKRELEEEVFQPDHLPPYSGPVPTNKGLGERTVKIVMPDMESMELLDKHFKIARYIENSISFPDKLIALLHGLEDGSLIYDKDTKSYKAKGQSSNPFRRGNCKRIKKMGRGKQRFSRNS